MYGGTYGSTGGSIAYRPQVDYWGLRNEIKRKDGPQHFNYFELGPSEENNIHSQYGRPAQGYGERPSLHQAAYGERVQSQQGGMNWGQMWTRRPGVEGETKIRF
jgi:hypothetical protein